MDKIAIILVIYNNKRYIKQCLDSLYNQTYNNIEIIAVNNATRDGGAAFIKENYKDVDVIDLQSNLGFAAASNIGIEQALNEKAKYCMLLNVDTVAEPNLLENLMRYADSNTVLTPYIYYSKDKKYKKYNKETCGTWYAGGGFDIKTGNVVQNLYDECCDNCAHEVDFISGCCMLIPEDVIKRVGVLQEKYFMYFEDAEYCMRLKNKGIIQKYIPNAALWHAETGSQVQNSSINHDYYCMRNKLYFMEEFPEIYGDYFLEILKNNFNTLKGYEIETDSDGIKAEIEGINDFLLGEIGEKIWKT